MGKQALQWLLIIGGSISIGTGAGWLENRSVFGPVLPPTLSESFQLIIATPDRLWFALGYTLIDIIVLGIGLIFLRLRANAVNSSYSDDYSFWNYPADSFWTSLKAAFALIFMGLAAMVMALQWTVAVIVTIAVFIAGAATEEKQGRRRYRRRRY